ncbi:MAG: HAMP domain-containing histidine kinase [Burkholderiaceae bacterium]|nr:HAMP domain-containing histidine kinase [Burkholderiaceae bacterium]
MPESFWRTLRWFAGGRLVVATVLVTLVWLSRTEPVFSFDHFEFFAPVAFAYLLLAIAFFALLGVLRPLYYPQVVAHVVTDLTVFTVLIWAGGGVRSGLGAMMVAAMVGAATVSPPRLATAFAAAASLLLLGETALRVGDGGHFEASAFTQAGLLGSACFIAALAVSWLASRLHAQEALARRRGEELQSQLAVTRQVMAELDRGIVVIGGNGQVRAINRVAQVMLGINPATWTAAPLRVEDLAMGAWSELLPALARARSRRSGAASAEFDLEQSPGTVEPVRRIGLRVLGGRAAGPSDTVVLLEDLRLVEARAQQLKLAAMGRLSASIAHEIRNPLGAIRHANGLLSETLGLTSQRRLARIIEDNTLRINRIIEDVLAIARRERALEEPIAMREFLGGFVADYRSQEGVEAERIGLLVSSARELHFDENHLRQVLYNLLHNALRHASSSAAAILIEWRERDGGRTELLVCDDGPGMSEEALAYAFEPFFTTDSMGTGLGLYLARELCRSNHASIYYEALGPDSRYRGAFVVTQQDRSEGARTVGNDMVEYAQ